jgi:catechol 2,3-dioxygenase-like lactoylglutathione lyase family enzyme
MLKQVNLEKILMLRTIRNLDYVILLCHDVELMKAFYRDVMGFPVYRDLGGWYEMNVGASLLTLRSRGRPYDGEHAHGAASIQMAFRVAPQEVDDCYQELLAQGVEIIEPPRDQDFGHRTLFFKDPEGNILEIYADIRPAS